MHGEYVCYVCKKTFSRQSEFDRHERIHTGEKSFVCDVCGRGFSESTALTKHKRVHTGEQPFACDVCGKRFALASNLAIHRQIHTREKPFVCDVCGRPFARQYDLNNHRQTHRETWDKYYFCDFDNCTATFCQQRYLDRHMVRTHHIKKRHTQLTQKDLDIFNEFFQDQFANEDLAKVTQSPHLNSQYEQDTQQAIQQSRITAYEHGDIPGSSNFLLTQRSPSPRLLFPPRTSMPSEHMPSPIGQPLQHCHSPSHFTQADADEFDNNEFFEGRFANEVLARMRGIVTQSSPHTPNHLDSQDEQYMLQAIQQSRITAYEHGDMPGPSDFLSTAQSSGAIERQPVSSSQRYAPHQQPQRSSSPPRTSMPPERMSSPIGHPAPQSSQGYNSYTPPSPTSPMHPPTPPSMQRRSPSRLPIRYDIYGNQRTNDDEDNDYPWNTPNSSPKR